MEWLQSNFRDMAMKPRGYRFAFVFVSVTALGLLVPASQDDPLSVQAPVVYGVVGKPLTLVCTVNETVLVAGEVSWKHNGKWLRNQTVLDAARVMLMFKSVKDKDSGIYQCGVYNLTGQGNAGKPIPKDKNVSLLVGGDILSKPVCISFGWPPVTTLVWNAVDYHQTLKLTYSAFYCSPPNFGNRFCSKPPMGYKRIGQYCTNVSFVKIDASLRSREDEYSSLECNVSSLTKTLFPDLFDPHAQSSGGSVIVFSINLENVFSPRYSPISTCRLTSQSSPSALRKCTRPKNVRAVTHERRELSLLWNPPSDMGDFIWILDYIVLYAREGETANQTLDEIDIDAKEIVNISASIRDLEPYSIYHLYIACSLKGSYSPYTRGQFIGPFSGRTLEEEPSGKPEVLNYWSFKIDGNLRNVTVQWKLPDNRTWNGVIRYFLIDYWTASNSSSSPDQNGTQVIVLSNVSMTTGHVSELDVHKSYGVTVRMCTIPGCGPPSNVRFIEALRDGGAPRTGSQANMSLIIGILSGILLFGLCALFVSWLWMKRSRRKRLQRKKRTLSEVIGELNAPQYYGVSNERPKAVSDECDHTYASLHKGSGDYVKIKKPKESST